jgi:hypothetical protein
VIKHTKAELRNIVFICRNEIHQTICISIKGDAQLQSRTLVHNACRFFKIEAEDLPSLQHLSQTDTNNMDAASNAADCVSRNDNEAHCGT